MSTPPAGKLPLPELAAMKARGDKIVMVTAYDAPGARFAEDSGVDLVLVGDTAAMVVLGYEGTTVPVTMDEMLFLTRTVARAARRPIVVGDMPFGSYRRARHLLAFAAVPLVFALPLWVVRLSVYGEDALRRGGADSGTGNTVFEAVELGLLVWVLALLVVGVRIVHGWTWARSLAASGFLLGLAALALADAYGAF